MFYSLYIYYTVWLRTKLQTLSFFSLNVTVSLVNAHCQCKAVYDTTYLEYTIFVHICLRDLLIKVSFGNGEEAAVPLGSDSEYEGLSSQDGKLTDKLSGVCHKQACLLFTVNHPLVNVEEARNHKLDAHLLKHQEEKERRAKIWQSEGECQHSGVEMGHPDLSSNQKLFSQLSQH